MKSEINSREIINKVKEIFKMFYGKEYESLIDERMDNLVDIIFYNNKDLNTNINDIRDYLKYYEITKYNDEIITKKIPISRYILEHGEQGTMMFLDDNKLKMIIYFPLNVCKKYNYDCILIHELLHVLDEHICYDDSNTVVSRGGFETMNLKGDANNERNYEFLNETLHQRIAEEITKFAHDKGIFLFNNYDESQISNNEYDKDHCIVIEKFYDSFKDDLLIDKMVGNVEEFISAVGNDNFEELNKWIIDYYNKYPTPDIRKQLNEHPSEEYNKTIKEGIIIINEMINKKGMVK